MIKERYIKNLKDISINIAQSNIKSIRKRSISKTGYRVYKNGFIGIAGGIGEVDKSQLEKMAIENLKLEIPYPYDPSTDYVRKLDHRKEIFSHEEFVEEIECLLQILRDEFPDFIFSNSIDIQEFESKLVNNKGLDLVNIDRVVRASIIIKEKDSLNIFDAASAFEDREYSREKILKNTRETLEAYRNKVRLPFKGKQAVIFMGNDRVPFMKLIEEMNGYKVGTGASLFTDFMGKKKFSDDLTLYQGAEEKDSIGVEFFDAEGTVNPNNIYSLIGNGKIITPYTDKKTAAQFNLPLTGSASSDYDKVPSLTPRNFDVKSSGKSLKELLNGELGIFVIMASGGDFSQDGIFGTPVQLAFLTDGEKLLGRLPELTVSGELYSMFGEDFIGKSENKALLGEKAIVFKLNVDYI